MAESMKADNAKLYKKVRYLQSSIASAARGAATTRWARTRAAAVEILRDLDLEALEHRYEASVDPFRQFSRAERQRKFK